jgi:phosphonate transport system substrate-binding protein
MNTTYLTKLSAWFICLVCTILPNITLAHETKVLHVGLLPIWTTRVLIKNYQPLQAHLEHELNQPVELITAPDFKTFHANTLNGEYDLIITAAHLGRLAQTEAGYTPLARYSAPHRTLLIAAKDQPLKSIQDLRGKILAGIDPVTLAMNDTIIWLRDQGLHAGTDFTLLETPTPISAAYSVQNHQSILAISSPQGMKQLPDNMKASIEIFASLPELPSLLWLAHPRMQAEIPRLKAALLSFTPQTENGAIFYESTGYMGMREPGNDDAKTMDKVSQEVKKHLKNNIK